MSDNSPFPINLEAPFAQPDPATFHGYLDSVEDALLVIEATRAGRLLRMRRRLHSSKEAKFVRSGAVFVFDELEAGIKRWTGEKIMWSPSRQLGSFFVYRQMSVKVPRGTTLKDIEAMTCPPDGEWVGATSQQQAEEKPYVGSLLTSSTYARDGLIKKTLAVGTTHVISYFKIEDVINGRLATPSSLPLFNGLGIAPELRKLATPTSASNNSICSTDHPIALRPTSATSSREASGSQTLPQAPRVHVNDDWPSKALGDSRSRAASLPGPHFTAAVTAASELAQPSSPTSQDWLQLQLLQPVPLHVSSMDGGGDSHDAALQSSSRWQMDQAGAVQLGSMSTSQVVECHAPLYHASAFRQSAHAQPYPTSTLQAPPRSLPFSSSCPPTSMWPTEPSPNMPLLQQSWEPDHRTEPLFSTSAEDPPSSAGHAHSTSYVPLQDSHADAMTETSLLLMPSSQVPSGLAVGRLSVDCGTSHMALPRYAAHAAVPWNGLEAGRSSYVQDHPCRLLQEQAATPAPPPRLLQPRLQHSQSTPCAVISSSTQFPRYGYYQYEPRDVHGQTQDRYYPQQLPQQSGYGHSRDSVFHAPYRY